MFLLLLVISFSFSQCAEILMMVSFPSKSHYFLIEPLARELGERGHHITFITSYKSNTAWKNVHEIFIDNDFIFGKNGTEGNNYFEFHDYGAISNTVIFPLLGLTMCDAVLSNPEVKSILDSGKQFDVIIGEAFLTESILGGLTYKLKAPLIAYGTYMPCIWVNYMVGNEAPTSYIPDPLAMIEKPMSFKGRLGNFIFNILLGDFYNLGVYLYKQNEIFQKHFGPDAPYLKSILKNTSALLITDHPALTYPRPTVPNLISVAGLHVKPIKPLPNDLKNIMDVSEHGVVLFSMGSNIQSKHMPQDKLNMILQAFARLKQTVLWKFETDLPNKPKNVYIRNWLPQSDILAHPNLKLFITHGGLLSTTESIHHGIPIIGLPIYSDQPQNMRQSENAGVGLTVNYDDLTEDLFYNAIQEVINNPKYNDAAKHRSKVFKDNPQTPMERAIFWVEYVIRHKGAYHLRSGAQDLLWYEYYQLDVIAVILITLYIIFKLTLLVLKRILALLFKTNTPSVHKKKQN